ncbi:MAG: ABC transporter permease [Clostridia bacterium]|nr:ABC transporter permease [Clostridia bacterium]
MELVKKLFREHRIPLLTVLLFVFMSLTRQYFFTKANMFAIVDSITGYGIAAIGFTFVMLCGQLDISFGSVMALTACSFMMLLPHAGFAVSLLVALVMGCVCGTITGFFIASFRLSPFIVSMTMQLAFKGIALTMTKSTPVSLAHPTLLAFNRAKLFGIFPAVFFIFIAVALVAEFVLRRTQYGRNLYIIGGNINVADNLGLPTRRYLWSVFIIQGFTAALAGVCMMTRMFSASGNLALDGPFSVIPMVIVGGTAMAGGRGGAVKTLWGVILMNIVYNAMTMYSIPASLQPMVKGLVLLIVIVSDKYMEHRHEKI